MTEPTLREELRACPFCGGEPILSRIGNEHTKRTVTIKCAKCRIGVTHAALRNDFEWLEKVARDSWNTRHPDPPATDKRIAELEADNNRLHDTIIEQARQDKGALDGMRAELEAARGALLEVEWAAHHPHTGYKSCPCCMSYHGEGHTPTCKVGRALSTLTAPAWQEEARKAWERMRQFLENCGHDGMLTDCSVCKDMRDIDAFLLRHCKGGGA